MIRKVNYIILASLLFQSCKTMSLINDKGCFYGSISYDINYKINVDTIYQVDKSGIYGNKLEWTFFKNGDVQQKYFGSYIDGLDLVFWDLSEKKIITKYNSSDTLFIKDASQKFSDFVKKQKSSTSSNFIKLIFKVPANQLSKEYFYMYSCDYLKEVYIDVNRYSDFFHEQFYDIINLTNGCIPMNYQLDFFSYAINYETTGFNENITRYKEKISRKSPRINISN